ncbi:ornithine carbamoyltransferase [Terricaulis sp.]|uniref:ornithine carbamoyltransferase n=1 Tax=Terricaulis sp. TaxID=2768686 RepID=UPI003784B0E9
MSASPRHFLDISALSKAELRAILDEARRRKDARKGWPKGQHDSDAPLDGHVLAMIFQKNSTRTRVSFEVGMAQLGGGVISLNANDTQLGRGETIEDTARVLSRMVDAVMIRANVHQDVVDFAAAADVPVINGLTDLSHPCQIIADLMTIEEWSGDVAGKTVAWLGDGNNVCTSFIHAAEKLNFRLAIATPGQYAARTQEVAAARAAGADIFVTTDASKAIANAHVVVTDTWVSMGDVDKEAREAAFPPYAITEEAMAKAASNAIFLHCLPAHRGEEVSDAVIDGPRSAVWDEAENRIHAQKAVLLWCLNKI